MKKEEKNRKIVSIIQARMNSRRLPGKVLQEIEGVPMLGRVIDRVRASRLASLTVVATSEGASDDPVEAYCRSIDIPCFRGNEDDVLDRYYRAADRFGADVIVRITADCPLIDPIVIDRVIAAYLQGSCDYASNRIRYTYPDGLDTEVFSREALAETWRSARKKAEREHVTPYIRESGRFRVAGVECETDLSQRDMRWTVDEPADLEFVRSIFKRLGGNRKPFGMWDVIRLLDKESRLAGSGAKTVRNEGYYRSLIEEEKVSPRRLKLAKSRKMLSRAEALIPSCTQTFSKGPTQFVQGAAPAFVSRAKGSRVWDVDGNEYIDYPMALGPVILGHGYGPVTKAVARQIRRGTAYSLPHELELELAELIAAVIPCAEMVRYGKNGSDVTAGAVRLARAWTGRDVVACCGYHGWQDWYIGTTTRNRGVPESTCKLTIPFAYNRIESLEEVFTRQSGKVAAVIMEPAGATKPSDGFLQKVAELCRREGALLIFDEVITGFRLALGGAQEFFGVKPDLACFGKALANGYPLSALVGRRDVMEMLDEVFFSFTFGGEAASLAAAFATIGEMQRRNVIAFLWEQGRKLQDGFNVIAREYGMSGLASCDGYPPRTVVRFPSGDGSDDLALKSLFQQECLKRGILFTGIHNVSFSHTDDDINYTLRVYRTVMETAAEAVRTGMVLSLIEGKPVQPVFRKV
ncbi:MAG TPA: aminotransferase class III-fold pyridoxal phosphate-dependent enzyme [Syntrophales bacterium]|nr:aminotransferase class III-fold pyridoxal phosphate-dependent enzyme [Syntrophales bacterium]